MTEWSRSRNVPQRQRLHIPAAGRTWWCVMHTVCAADEQEALLMWTGSRLCADPGLLGPKRHRSCELSALINTVGESVIVPSPQHANISWQSSWLAAPSVVRSSDLSGAKTDIITELNWPITGIQNNTEKQGFFFLLGVKWETTCVKTPHPQFTSWLISVFFQSYMTWRLSITFWNLSKIHTIMAALLWLRPYYDYVMYVLYTWTKIKQHCYFYFKPNGTPETSVIRKSESLTNLSSSLWNKEGEAVILWHLLVTVDLCTELTTGFQSEHFISWHKHMLNLFQHNIMFLFLCVDLNKWLYWYWHDFSNKLFLKKHCGYESLLQEQQCSCNNVVARNPPKNILDLCKPCIMGGKTCKSETK